jgi:hypothetical protein
VGTADLPVTTDFATRSGSVRQFADFSDDVPSDGDIYEWSDAVGALVPVDATTRFAAADPTTSELAESAIPAVLLRGYVVEEGEEPPANAPDGSLKIILPSAGSLVPLLAEHATAQGNANVVATTDQTFEVGDPIILVVGSTAEAIAPSDYTFTISSGAATLNERVEAVGGTTAQATIFSGRVTTQIPAGATITVNANQPGTTTDQARVHFHAAIIKPQGLVSSPTTAFDQAASVNGTNGSNLNIATGLTPAPTAQANEVAIFAVFFNSMVGAGVRSIAGTDGWTELSIVESEGGQGRTLAVFYKILNSTGQVQGTATFTSTDGQTGQYAGVLATFRGL